MEEDSDDDDIGFNHYNEDSPQRQQIQTHDETNDGCSNTAGNNMEAEESFAEEDADPEEAAVNKESEGE